MLLAIAGPLLADVVLEADYILIQRAEQTHVGERPVVDTFWKLGGGGCMSLVGPGFNGGLESRWTEDMDAMGYHRGPNGIAEHGGGDDIELGTVRATWSISDTAYDAHSGMFSLTDSPDGPYDRDWDYAATIAQAFDFAGADSIELSFWHHWNFRYNSQSDYGRVEVSYDGLDGWETVVTYNYAGGFHGVFFEERVDLSAYADSGDVMIRFFIHSGPSSHADGWFIDDLLLMADGEIVFSDDFESGTDSWTLDGEWGLKGATTEVVYLDRTGDPLYFPVSRDIYGVPLATIDAETGAMIANPVGLPTLLFEGEGYTWVVARYNGAQDAVMVYHSAQCWVPE